MNHSWRCRRDDQNQLSVDAGIKLMEMVRLYSVSGQAVVVGSLHDEDEAICVELTLLHLLIKHETESPEGGVRLLYIPTLRGFLVADAIHAMNCPTCSLSMARA